MIRRNTRLPDGRFVAALLVCMLPACGSDSGTGPSEEPGPGGETPAITLALSATSATVQQGGTTTLVATVMRTGGYTGAVDFAVQNTPTGVTAAQTNTQTVSGITTTTLTLQVAANAAPGAHALTVRASGSGVSAQTATFTLTVTPLNTGGGGGNVSVDFASCPAAARPSWFAFQDGDGAWTRVTGANHVYRFDVSSSKGAYAFKTNQGGGDLVTIHYLTRAELTAQPVRYCAEMGTKTVSGTVTGLAANDFAQIWLGGGAGNASANGAFQIVGVQDGRHDLVAWRHSILGNGSPTRGFIRRDQEIANGGSVGTIDFGGADAFTPATAQVSVTGLAAGEQLTHVMGYYTGACVYSNLYQGLVPPGATTMTVTGFPASHQRDTDIHHLSVTAIAANGTRVAQEFFHTLGNRTVALPAPVGAPTVTTLQGPYKRLQASATVPAEYNAAAIFHYTDQTSQHGVNMTASYAWIGGGSVTLAMPDFSQVDGWNNAWMPAPTAAGTWLVQLLGSTLTGNTLCQEGARAVSVQLMGSH